jgi:hypothetical protein
MAAAALAGLPDRSVDVREPSPRDVLLYPYESFSQWCD